MNHKTFLLSSESDSINDKGITIVLKNGYSVSIQFDKHHYCGSTTVETALFSPDKEFVPYGNRANDCGNNDVQRYMDVDEVIDLLNYAKNLKTPEKVEYLAPGIPMYEEAK
tara:strand:+ start:851 stop:1183 length:333 start_codon:yes stop_codon:yes gene_type:complete